MMLFGVHIACTLSSSATIKRLKTDQVAEQLDDCIMMKRKTAHVQLGLGFQLGLALQHSVLPCICHSCSSRHSLRYVMIQLLLLHGIQVAARAQRL